MTHIECADPPMPPGAVTCGIPATRIFEMLDLAYGLRHFDILPKTPSFDAVPGLFEEAVSILAALAENRIRRGLYRRLVEQPEDLRFFPSQAGGAGWLQRAFGEDPYLRCRYDGSLSDFEDNEILLWTLYTASKARLSREGLAQQLTQSYRALAGSMALTAENANAGITRFYRRLERGERPIHGLCRLILEQFGPGLWNNATQPNPSALNMAALFQAFIAAWLKTNRVEGFTVRVRSVSQFGAGSTRTVERDITLEDQGARQPVVAVKTVEAFPKDPEIRKFLDTVAKMRLPGRSDPATAVIVYPSVQAATGRMTCTQNDGIAVRIVGFDLTKAPDAAGADFLGRIGLET